MLRDGSDDAVQNGVVPFPSHSQVAGTVIEDVCEGLLLASTMAALCAGDLFVASCLLRAHRQQIQPSPVYKPVLVERQERSSVCEVVGVTVKGDGVEGPALVIRAFDIGQVACSKCLLQHLEGPLPLGPAEVVVASVEDSRVWC